MVFLLCYIITCECVWKRRDVRLMETGVKLREVFGEFPAEGLQKGCRMFARPTYVGDNITLVI